MPLPPATIHVLHIASGDLWAGAEVQLFTLTCALNKLADTRVSVILFNHGTLEKKLLEMGISVFVYDESKTGSLKLLQQLRLAIKKIQPDVIHTHRSKENILGSIAALLSGRIPSLRTVHGAPEHLAPIYKLHKRIIPLLDRLCGRYYQRSIVAVSPDLAKTLETKFPEHRVNMIENGIDTESFAHLSKPEKNTNHSRIGIIGRLVPVKRVDLFIQTAILIKQQHPELSLDFCIYGDGPLAEDLQNRVNRQHAENYIHFEGHCENIAMQLQTLDALLMTSDHEGLPMVLLEAMCLKTPIIAHAVGGIPHLLEQGKSGTLVHDHNAETFAAAITRQLTHHEETQRKTQNAFARVNQHYSAQQNASNYLHLYRQICHH